jgi:hypothetical protein
VARVLGGLAVALGLGAIVLAAVNGLSLWQLVLAHDAIGISTALTLGVLGVLILRQDRHNRLGWLFVLIGVAVGVYVVSRQYALLAPHRPGWAFATWLALWVNLPVIMASGFQFLLFPDGRPPSRRWRPVVWANLVLIAGFAVVLAAVTWPLRAHPGILDDQGSIYSRVFSLGFTTSNLLFLVAVVSLIARYRGAGGVRREQIKWVMWSQVIAVPLSLPATVGTIGPILELLTVPLTYGAIAVAIFRYHLFDIDRLVSRTLVYVLLSAFVVGGYVLGVLVVGNLFTPAGRPGSVFVAGTTLAIAALFQPVRRRVQNAVDRRFNRRRYDAARTIEAFAARLRHHTDLDELRAEVIAVLDHTMQPTQASLWLAPGNRGQKEDAVVIAARASSV